MLNIWLFLKWTAASELSDQRDVLRSPLYVDASPLQVGLTSHRGIMYIFLIQRFITRGSVADRERHHVYFSFIIKQFSISLSYILMDSGVADYLIFYSLSVFLTSVLLSYTRYSITYSLFSFHFLFYYHLSFLLFLCS